MASANRPATTVPSREGMSAVRCSFVHLGQPYANKPGDTPKYQVTCMFNKNDPADIAAVNQLAADLEACRIEQFPNEATRPLTPIIAMQPGQGPKSPIKDGDIAVDGNGRLIKEKNPEYAGHYIVAASNTTPVSVIGPNMEQIDANMCRSGYWYKVNVNAYAYTNNGGGVTVGLNGAQMMREDTVLGGGGPPVDTMFAATGGQDPNMYGQPVQGQPVQQPNQVAAPQPAPQQPVYQPVPQNPGVIANPAPPANVAPQTVVQPTQQYAGGAEQYVQQPSQSPVDPNVQPAPQIQQPGQQPVQQPLAQPGSIV